MKKYYRLIISHVRNLPQSIRKKKQWVAEYIELYSMIRRIPVKGYTLTREQREEIQKYWEPIFGRKISTKWHCKYTAFNHSFDVKYFPEIFYTTKLEPSCNPDWITYPLSDKNLTEMLFAKVLNKMVVVPHTITGCANGFCFNYNRKPVSQKECLEILNRFTGECIIKPTQGESSGHGVRLLNLDRGVDLLTGDRVKDIVVRYKNNFIVQKKIKQHASYGKIHPNSINTIRILTYRVENEIKTAPAIMRIGTGGSHLDNAHAGGVFVGISDEGLLQDRAYKLYCEPYAVHPDTKIAFKDYQVPYMPQIIALAKELHECLPGIGFANWDFAVNEDNQIVLIECNLSCGGIWVFQIAWGAGVFGEDTEYMIKILKSGPC